MHTVPTFALVSIEQVLFGTNKNELTCITEKFSSHYARRSISRLTLKTDWILCLANPQS